MSETRKREGLTSSSEKVSRATPINVGLREKGILYDAVG